jgi:hypothetical protein
MNTARTQNPAVPLRYPLDRRLQVADSESLNPSKTLGPSVVTDDNHGRTSSVTRRRFPQQLKTEPGDPNKTRVMTGDVRPTWGHPLLDPFDNEIRLPQFAFAQLRRLGLLYKNRTKGLMQISDDVLDLIQPEYDCLMGSLRRMLGADLSGPEWVVCRCRQCKRKDEDADNTKLPRQTQSSPGFAGPQRPGLYRF